MRIALTALAILACVGAATAAMPRPTLQLANTGDLVVRGTGFAKFEPLKVTAFVRGGPLVRRIAAGRLGSFTVRLDGQLDACTAGHLIQVFGPKSGLVRMKMSLRECPQLAIP